jgi:hypothetical protein
MLRQDQPGGAAHQGEAQVDVLQEHVRSGCLALVLNRVFDPQARRIQPGPHAPAEKQVFPEKDGFAHAAFHPQAAFVVLPV